MHAHGVRARWCALVILLLAAAGCGRNQGSYPAGFVPEGVLSTTTFLSIAVDSPLVRPDGTPGAGVLVTVVDNSMTDSFVLYRMLDGETSFRPIQTFPVPFGQTFNSAYRTFNTVDWDVQSNRGALYLARGVVNGAESKRSPLSTTAVLPAAPIPSLLPESFNLLAPIDTVDTDSLPTFSWAPVPGAQRYLVQLIRSDGKFFAAVLTPTDGSTSYTLQSGAGLVLHEMILTRSAYFWTALAFDASGRQIGTASEFQIFIFSLPPLE